MPCGQRRQSRKRSRSNLRTSFRAGRARFSIPESVKRFRPLRLDRHPARSEIEEGPWKKGRNVDSRRGVSSGHLGPLGGGANLEADTAARVVQARFWGFWDLEVAERFRADLLASSDRMDGKTWSILVDSRTFLPQGPEVTRHRGETMVMILHRGCSRIAVIVSENGTYSMQFMRIANEAGVKGAVFLDPVDALRWIREA
jgi:hypothetical protein